jgi:UTP--glucose-1-phosphate uridylyltransferase
VQVPESMTTGILHPPTKALIPCGGKGTRMMGLSRGGAKELLPVAGKPLLLWALGECAASGIGDVMIVISPGKEDIAEAALAAAGRAGMPTRVEIGVQREPRGLADAIRVGREFAGGEPLGVALPDNVFLGDAPALAQVGAVYTATGKNVVAMVELFQKDAARYGPTSIYPGEIAGDEFRISAVPDKGDRGKTFDLKGARSGFTGVGRYVFASEVFETIDEVESGLGTGQELDDIPVMRLLLERRRLTGCRIRGDFLDVGIPSGYSEANDRLMDRAGRVSSPS